MIPTSKVVNVSILTSPTFPQVQGFGVLMIAGSSTNLPSGDRLRAYANLAAVAVDFGTNTEEYLAASVFFAQKPTPNNLLIGRRFTAATPAELLGSSTPTLTLATYTAISTGSLSLTVDGTAVNLTTLNLTGAASLNAVATIVQTALAAVKAGATVIFTGTRFIVRSGTTGGTSTITVAGTPGSGTDLAPLMGLNAASFAVATQGFALETVTASLTALAALQLPFYSFVLTNPSTVQNHLDAAAFAEGTQRIYGFTSADANIPDGTQTNDVFSQLKTLNYSRTIGQYDAILSYAIVSALAFAFGVDFTAQNSTVTLKFKLEPGVVPLNITESQRLALVAKNANYYTYFGTSAMLAEGVVVNGRFFDEVFGLDWLSNDMQNSVFGYLYTTSTKVPQTDKGMARLIQVVTQSCQRGVNNGLIAPGVWLGGPLGTVKTNDFLPTGYYVFAPPVSSQAQAQRSSRQAPPITVLVKGAGAIHGVNIAISFQQ